MSEITRQRIKQRLDELQLTPNAASTSAGMDRSTLGKFLQDKVDELRDTNLKALAEVLNCDPRYLRGEIDSLTAPPESASQSYPIPHNLDVPILGIAEAGAFRRIDWNRELGKIVNGVRPEFARDQQFGILMRDDSMLLAGINVGDELVCVNPWTTGVEIGEGDWVLVQVRAQGQKNSELTVKELVIESDHWLLRPRCANEADYQAYTLPSGANLSESGQVKIIGLVVSVSRHRPIRMSARATIPPSRSTKKPQSALGRFSDALAAG
jgi:SOS-response transcriptional repressor LexA